MSNKDLSRKHFEEILQDTINQVFSGKGMERHGHGSSFEDQPWRHISDNVGEGFALGQAMKKLMELRTFDNLPAWKREALGAIVYIVMAIMWKEKMDKKQSNEQESIYTVVGGAKILEDLDNEIETSIPQLEPIRKSIEDFIPTITVGGKKYTPYDPDKDFHTWASDNRDQC